MTNQKNITQHSHSIAKNHIRKAIELYHEMPISKRDVLMKWKKKLFAFHTHESLPYDYLYNMSIGLPTGIFSYQFDPTSIIHYLTVEEITPIQLDMALMETKVDEETWSLNEDDTPYPVVLLETPLLPKGYLLSGHKNVLEAKRLGKKNIQVYVLTEMEFLPLMFDDLSKAMYSFHRDLQNIISSPICPPTHALFLTHVDSYLETTKKGVTCFEREYPDLHP